ncbi:MAG: AAA family ATPase [Ignavibacteria bacterium]|nr:AAA family ATPase [Ignavibacteria bacterium]
MNLGKKILVVGANGSGKTTFAKKLSKILNITHYELDNIFWKPDWMESENAEFRAKVDDITQTESWIIDGNYSRNQDLTICRADTIIWLDVPYVKMLYRVVKRSLYRIVTQKPLWHNNRESFGKLFSGSSIILFASRTYGSKNAKYNRLINGSEFAGKKWIRLKSSREEKRFWKEINSSDDIKSSDE